MNKNIVFQMFIFYIKYESASHSEGGDILVINWKEQIQSCIDQTTVIPIFHAMPVEQKLEEILITKKLLEMKYEAEQILAWFQLAEQDCQKSMFDVYTLIELAKKRRWPKSHNFTIFITKDEIEHIKDLNATKECKSFLLATVAFGKMMNIKRKKPTFNLRERSYIYYLATGRDDYNVGAHRAAFIQDFISQLVSMSEIKLKIVHTSISVYTGKRGGAKKKLTDLVLNASWINYKAFAGYEITSKSLESEIKRLCDLAFSDDVRKCECCGKEFDITSRTRRTLCDECYKEKRMAVKREVARSYYGCKARTNEWTEKDDELLKFIYSGEDKKKIKQLIIENFPDRNLKSVYNRANYLNLKKNKNLKIIQKD